MIFGDPPAFETLLENVASLETCLNEKKGKTGRRDDAFWGSCRYEARGGRARFGLCLALQLSSNCLFRLRRAANIGFLLPDKFQTND